MESLKEKVMASLHHPKEDDLKPKPLEEEVMGIQFTLEEKEQAEVRVE